MTLGLKILSSLFAMLALLTMGCSADAQNTSPDVIGQVYNTIYWSDGDSGRLDGLKLCLPKSLAKVGNGIERYESYEKSRESSERHR